MSVVSTILGRYTSPINTLHLLSNESASNDHNQDKSVKRKYMEKYEFLDQTIDELLQTYTGLQRGFKKGYPHHPFVGDVGERWIPIFKMIRSVPWSTGEAMIAAILVDVFHDEYGADQMVGFKEKELYVNGEYRRLSEWLWPNVRDVTKKFPYLDREAYHALSKLICK